MKKLVEYEIISGYDPADLADEIKEILILKRYPSYEGYELYGSPWSAKDKNKDLCFYQAIVKYEEEENKVI